MLPILLLIFFELLGNAVANKLGIKKFKFNSIIGFAAFLGIYYVLCFPLIFLKVNFKMLLLTTLIYFLLCIIFIIKNYKSIKLSVNFLSVISMLVIVCIQLLFVFNNTIGSLSLYDTINYANLTTSNIYSNGLNTIDFMNGFPGENVGYAYQAYYTLASVLYYMANGVLTNLNISFFYFTQHTWMYSVILYFFIAELFVNFVSEFKIKSKIGKLFLFIFIILFMGNFYWNSEQAYLGNSFRMILTSYMLIYIYSFFKNKDKNNLLMLILLSYANAACANSNSTLVVILAFALWIIGDYDDIFTKSLIIMVIFPIINISMQVGLKYFYILILVLLLIVILIFANKFNEIAKKVKLKFILTLFVTMFLIISSVIISGSLFSFDGFINNLSGWSDMTWDYTDFSSLWRVLANIIYIAMLLIVFIKMKDNKAIRVLILIVIVFFNPFAANVQNEYMPVFYRNYDIVMNYFTIFLSIKILDNYDIKWKNMILILMTLVSTYSAYKQILYHPNDSFIKKDDYNEILRMTNDEADALLFVKDFVINNNIHDAKAISSILQVHTELPYIKTLYGRNKTFNKILNDYELYKIFYPVDYYGDPYAPKEPDYCNMCNLLKNSDYKLIVQDKRVDYYDSNSDTYYSLTYLINECGEYPIYENDTYAIYYYEK